MFDPGPRGSAPTAQATPGSRPVFWLGEPTPEESRLVAELNARYPEPDYDDWDDLGPAGTSPASRRADGPRLEAEDLAGHEPGARLAQLLAEVEDADVDDYAAVELVAAWYRLTAWVQAGAARAAARLGARPGMTVAPSPTAQHARAHRRPGLGSAAAHEIALRLAISRSGAQTMIDTGRALTGALGLVGDALADGLIDLPRARAFVEGLSGAPLEIALDVQEAVLPNAPNRTVRQVRSDIARALVGVDPEEATRRYRSARNRRRVCHPTPLPDGMAGIWSVLPAPDAVALDAALDAAAHTAKSSGDERSIDQLRADVLASVGHRALETGSFGEAADVTVDGEQQRGRTPGRNTGRGGRRTRGGRSSSPRTQIRVTVPLGVLVRGEGAPAVASPSRVDDPALAEVAELDGYGPITPDVARALALGGTWRRLVTDPGSGAVLDVGRTRYRPPAELAELVRARDRTCVRPGCSARAQGCDLDHTVPYHLGGHTADWNLGCLCPTDHALKTAGGYVLRQVRPGVFEAEMPSGHAYRREADGSTSPLPRSRPHDPQANDPPPF